MIRGFLGWGAAKFGQIPRNLLGEGGGQQDVGNRTNAPAIMAHTE